MEQEQVKDEREIIADKVQKALGVTCAYVEIEEFFIDHSNDFYEKNDRIWDDLKDDYDKLEFPIDEMLEEAIDLENTEISDDAVEEVKEKLEQWGEDEKASKVKAGDKYAEYFEDFDDVIELVRDNTCPNINQDLIERDSFDDWETEERDGLAYWTVYFKPRVEDVEVALKCGLTPFYFDDEFYLALGGCGMDLSPKLDAYQALTTKMIPSDSKLLRGGDESYFGYVVGKDVMKEVLELCKRPTKRIKIEYDEM